MTLRKIVGALAVTLVFASAAAPAQAGKLKALLGGGAAVVAGVAGATYLAIQTKTPPAIAHYGTPQGEAALAVLQEELAKHRIVGPRAFLDAVMIVLGTDPGLEGNARAVLDALDIAQSQLDARLARRGQATPFDVNG